jgi:hypothetical protein
MEAGGFFKLEGPLRGMSKGVQSQTEKLKDPEA